MAENQARKRGSAKKRGEPKDEVVKQVAAEQPEKGKSSLIRTVSVNLTINTPYTYIPSKEGANISVYNEGVGDVFVGADAEPKQRPDDRLMTGESNTFKAKRLNFFTLSHPTVRIVEWE